jgi:hypothetical protein
MLHWKQRGAVLRMSWFNSYSPRRRWLSTAGYSVTHLSHPRHDTQHRFHPLPQSGANDRRRRYLGKRVVMAQSDLTGAMLTLDGS